MKTVQINLYEFDELEEKAKARAQTKYRYYNLEDDWWRDVFGDAARIFLKITSFDIDRGAYCNGEWMVDADKSANKIIEEYGDSSNTYQLAKQYLFASEKTQEVADIFLTKLLKEFLKMLLQEYDYLSSDEAIIEAFEANDQLFTADGHIANRIEKLINKEKL